MGHVAAEIPRPWTQISLSRPVPACRTSYESSLRIFGSQPLIETNGKMVSGVGVRGQGFRVEGWGETRVGFRVEGLALGIYAFHHAVSLNRRVSEGITQNTAKAKWVWTEDENRLTTRVHHACE